MPVEVTNVISFIEERRSGYTSKLYNEETLYTFLKTKIPSLSYIDFIIVLKYLVRDIGKCSVSKVDEVTYVKFDISTLTKEDIDIINLMASINKLTDRKQENGQNHRFEDANFNH